VTVSMATNPKMEDSLRTEQKWVTQVIFEL